MCGDSVSVWGEGECGVSASVLAVTVRECVMTVCKLGVGMTYVFKPAVIWCDLVKL